MFKLAPTVFLDGLESESALLLSALQNIAALTPPVAVASMRSQLETGQLQPFTDAGFNQYITRCYGLPLDNSALTAAERTILQNIREYISPAPSLSCCGVETPSIALTSIVAYPRIGTATFEHELQVVFDSEVTCDVSSVEVTLTPLAAAPAATVSPVTCLLLGCYDSSAVYSFLFVDFIDVVSGKSYDLALDVKDSAGVSLAAYTMAGFTFP